MEHCRFLLSVQGALLEVATGSYSPTLKRYCSELMLPASSFVDFNFLTNSHGYFKTKKTTYVALHKGTRCMAVRCPQNAPRHKQFHVAPAMAML